MAALNALGEQQYPGICPAVHLGGTVVRPQYPRVAAEHGIEGWVDVWMDIEPGGAIAYAFINASSMRGFEAPTLDWLKRQHAEPSDPTHPLDRPCTAKTRVVFKIQGAPAAFPVDSIANDNGYTYRSIGAAIRVRVDAYNAIIDAHDATN
nr:energy transducer TonB [Solimonas marina]